MRTYTFSNRTAWTTAHIVCANSRNQCTAWSRAAVNGTSNWTERWSASISVAPKSIRVCTRTNLQTSHLWSLPYMLTIYSFFGRVSQNWLRSSNFYRQPFVWKTSVRQSTASDCASRVIIRATSTWTKNSTSKRSWIVSTWPKPMVCQHHSIQINDCRRAAHPALMMLRRLHSSRIKRQWVHYCIWCRERGLTLPMQWAKSANTCFTNTHWTAVKRIMRYLKSTSAFKLKFSSSIAAGMVGYSDADFGGDIDTRRSTTGYVFKMQGGAISWASRRQPTVALSTTEAEYMALAAAIQEAIWLKQFAGEVGRILPCEPFVTKCDNQSAICLASNDGCSARSKHIDIRYHFIRNHIASRSVRVQYVSTNDMTADCLTKAVTSSKHLFCVSEMGLMNSTQST